MITTSGAPKTVDVMRKQMIKTDEQMIKLWNTFHFISTHHSISPALLNASNCPKLMDVLSQLLPNSLQVRRQHDLRGENSGDTDPICMDVYCFLLQTFVQIDIQYKYYISIAVNHADQTAW